MVKGGFEVETPQGPGFCSLSQIDARRVTDASSYLNQELEFVVSGQDEETGRLRLSRRKVVEREEKDRLGELRASIVPGAVLSGRVARLTDFGAFVDLGGIEGMVHVSEISHRRIERPAEVLGVGQEVQVRVLRAAKGAGKGASADGKKGERRGKRRSGRVALSIKGAEADPWSDAAEKFQPWQVADGRIVRVAEFGAFVELAPGIEGLLHESELPKGALSKLEEASQGGGVLAVLVLEVDRKRRRIALAPAPGSLAAGEHVEPVPLKPGQILAARVEEVQAGAVVVRIGPGQLGIIPNPEMGTPRGTDHKADFPAGTELEAEVLRVESGGRRARLSLKRAQRRQERAEVARYAKSQSVESLSTLGDLLDRARGGKADS